MATVETKWFTRGGKNLVEQEVGWVTGPINVMLMKAAYVFDQDGPEVYADLSAAEVVGIGYTAGGTALSGRSIGLDASLNETRLLGNPVQWPNSTITSRGAVVYATTGSKPVLGYCDFGMDRLSISGLFSIEWPNSIVLRATAS